MVRDESLFARSRRSSGLREKAVPTPHKQRGVHGPSGGKRKVLMLPFSLPSQSKGDHRASEHDTEMRRRLRDRERDG